MVYPALRQGGQLAALQAQQDGSTGWCRPPPVIVSDKSHGQLTTPDMASVLQLGENFTLSLGFTLEGDGALC